MTESSPLKFATEDEAEVAEIARLEDFMKNLEDELDRSDIHLFSNPPSLLRAPSNESLDSISDEPIDKFIEELQQENHPIQNLLSPFDDLSFDSEHPKSNPFASPASTIPPQSTFPFGENVLTVLKTPSSRLDDFLLALHKAGYGDIDFTRQRILSDPTKGYNSFFESALGREDSQKYPQQRHRGTSNPSPSDQEYIISKLNASMLSGDEDFTAEALRRNWDLEEEYEDELNEKIHSISKVIEEKRKQSMENLFSAKDEDITHYESLQPKQSLSLDPVSEEEEGEQETVKRSLNNELDQEAAEENEQHDEEEEVSRVNESQIRSLSVEEEEGPDFSADLLALSKIVGTDGHQDRRNSHDRNVSDEFSLSSPTASVTSISSKPKTSASSRRKKSFDHSVSSDPATSNTPPDSRLNGDFIIWSSGKMLNGDYTTEIYMGLYENNITHYIESGKLLPLKRLTATPSSLSGQQPNSHLFPDPFLASQSIHELTGNILSTTSNLLLQSTASASTAGPSSLLSTSATGGPVTMRGFYPIHVMECVIRPDIELKAFMSVIVKISKLLQLKCIPLQRSHIVITPGQQFTQSTTAKIASMITSTLQAATHPGSAVSTHTSGSEAMKEWDQVDIQVVISRELRQRVLLIQFLRRVPTQLFGASGLSGSNSISTSSNSSSNNPLNQSTAAITNLLTTTYEYIPLSRCPKTRKFISQIKKEIIQQQISLSALYNAPLKTVCGLPNGLDIHFLAQLNSLCRELMWQKLILDYKEMEDHIENHRKEANNVLKIMESMYKQYGLKVPDPWKRKRRPYFRPTHQIKEEKSDKNKNHQNTNNNEDNVGKDDLPRVSELSVDNGEENNNNGDSSNTKQYENIVIEEEGEDPREESLMSPSNTSSQRLQNRFVLDLLSTPNVDGMTFCLVMLDKCYYELQQRCDEEYMKKVQQRHELTLQYIQDIIDYKKELFYRLLDNPEYKTSKLFLSFKSTFTGIFVDEQLIISQPSETTTTPARSHKADETKNPSAKRPSATAITAPTSTTATTENGSRKSWFSLPFSFGSNNATASPTAVPPPAQPSPPTKPPTNTEASKGKGGATPTSFSTLFSPEPIQIDDSHVVLYYCSCLVNTIPGYFYLTKDHLFFTSSILGLNAKREVYSMTALQEIVLVNNSGAVVNETTTTGLRESIQSSASNLMNSNAIRITFTLKSQLLKEHQEKQQQQSQSSKRKISRDSGGSGRRSSSGEKDFLQKIEALPTKEVVLSPLTVDCQKLRMVILEVHTHFGDY